MSGDIVFGRKGAVDRSAWVKPAEEGWFLGSDGIRVRLPGSVDSRFVAYQLQSESVRAWLLQHSGGSTLLSLNQSTLSRVSLLLPPLADQRAIAEVLGALDDKIAANTKLTSMADVLGKGLFSKAVQAGTVRRVLLREIANNVPGKYLAKDDYENDGLYYVYGSNSVMGKHDKATAPGGFAVLAKIGSYCGNLRWSQRPAWVNNNASAIVPKGDTNPWILRHALDRIDMLRHRAGTGQPYIRMESLFSTRVGLPAADEAARIAPLLKSLSETEARADEENVVLAATRDALLPQLMSGALRIKDAEKVIEEVV